MVRNPPGLYSENQGIFNSTPYTQFALQQEAKQNAKDEALDKYYQDLPKSINPAGLRTQDTAGFIDKVNGIRDYYSKNRDAIKNPRLDRGQAQSTYQSMNTDALAYVNSSKSEEAKKAPFVKMLTSPDTRQRVLDSDLQKLHLHDLPLNDPNRKSFDFSTVDFNPKELSPQELQTYMKGLPSGFKPTETIESNVANPADLTRTITYKQEYSPDQLKAIADKAKASARVDRRIEYNADTAFDKIKDQPEQFDAYNKIHKSIYGTDIQTPEDLHAAMMVGGLIGQSRRTEIKPDENARDLRNFAQQKELENMRETHANRLAREKLGVGTDVNINDIYKNIDDATDKYETGITQKGIRVGTRVNALSADAQKVLVDYANKTLPGAQLGNNNLYFNKEKDGTIKLYRTDNSNEKEPNQVIKSDAYLIGDLPRVTVNLPAQPGVKEKRAVIQQGNVGSKPVVSNNGFTREELKAANWTDDQINKAVKAGKIKLN